MDQKLQTWSAQSISKARKFILLKTAAQFIPNFWMRLLRNPSEICDKIEKFINAYWWRDDGGSHGIRRMSWERFVKLKNLEN